MELIHAADILVEAAVLSQDEDGSIFDILTDAQHKLGLSDGCRQLASRFIVRGSPYTSLRAWELDPNKVYNTFDMISNGLKEIAVTPENPYKGFIFCTCVPQAALMYG